MPFGQAYLKTPPERPHQRISAFLMPRCHFDLRQRERTARHPTGGLRRLEAETAVTLFFYGNAVVSHSPRLDRQPPVLPWVYPYQITSYPERVASRTTPELRNPGYPRSHKYLPLHAGALWGAWPSRPWFPASRRKIDRFQWAWRDAKPRIRDGCAPRNKALLLTRRPPILLMRAVPRTSAFAPIRDGPTSDSPAAWLVQYFFLFGEGRLFCSDDFRHYS